MGSSLSQHHTYKSLPLGSTNRPLVAKYCPCTAGGGDTQGSWVTAMATQTERSTVNEKESYLGRGLDCASACTQRPWK